MNRKSTERHGQDFGFLIVRHFIQSCQKQQEKHKGNDESFCHKIFMGRVRSCSACLSAPTQHEHTAVQVWRELTAVLHAIAHVRKLDQAEFKAEAKDTKYSMGKLIFLSIFHEPFQKRTCNYLAGVLNRTFTAKRKPQEGKGSTSVDLQDIF